MHHNLRTTKNGMIKSNDARLRSFNLLKLFRNSDRSEVYRALYSKSNQEYRKLCELKKRAYVRNVADKLRNVKSTKDWWNWVKEFKDESYNELGNITSNEFGEHFKRLLNIDSNGFCIQYAFQNITDDFLDGDISLQEVNLALNNLPDRKAPGNDRIPIEFFKYGSNDLKQVITSILNRVIKGEDTSWTNKSIILPFHKKGDKNDTNNYRGISLVSSLNKLLSSILNARLGKWVEEKNILRENQAGFRSGYSTSDNLFNLNCLVKYLWYQGKKNVYCLFIDFKSAFDCVNRSALFFKLQNIGISLKFIRILEVIYNETLNSVWNGSSLSEWFETSSGVLQGSVLSPLLFAIFLNDLVDFIKGGVKVREVEINMLMYADDIVFVSDDPGRLQSMINRLKTYCDTWGLTVNTGKTQIIKLKIQRGW